MKVPFVSVCIPAYKHAEYLARLFNSLVLQSFRDFEVVVTDDSPDQSVSELVDQFSNSLNIVYHKNLNALGTPENWNQSIRLATGEWVKIMHDDDWFESNESLQRYVDVIRENPNSTFFFSAYINVNVGKTVSSNQHPPGHLETDSSSGLPDHRSGIIRPDKFRLAALLKNPVTLLSKNVIGPPSVTIHRNDKKHFYDPKMKWLVDMDFYMRYLRDSKPIYIDRPLVNIGINDLQVTKSSSLVREVEIPEHFLILEKTGVGQLNNILVYDAWWRMIRNLRIRNHEEIAEAGYRGEVPAAIKNIIRLQQSFSYSLLKVGPLSKSLMMTSYLQNKLIGDFGT